MNLQASPKSNGRALRRARNIVKRWQTQQGRENAAWRWPKGVPATKMQLDVHTAIHQGRYERAAALILAQKLSE